MKSPEQEKIKIDFSTRDTELGWMRRQDKFILKAVPVWFNLLGWMTLIGGIRYLSEKIDSRLLFWIYFNSLLLIMFYLFAAFEKIDFAGIFKVKSKKTQYILTSILSASLILGCNYLINRVIIEVAESSAIEYKPN